MNPNNPNLREEIKLTLPWPPTVNHIWKRGNRRTYLTEKGVAYYDKAITAIRKQLESEDWPDNVTDRLAVSIELYPPNRRKWDIDNRTKCVLDALAKADVMADDEQVDELTLKRCERDETKQGYALVTVRTI